MVLISGEGAIRILMTLYSCTATQQMDGAGILTIIRMHNLEMNMTGCLQLVHAYNEFLDELKFSLHDFRYIF